MGSGISYIIKLSMKAAKSLHYELNIFHLHEKYTSGSQVLDVGTAHSSFIFRELQFQTSCFSKNRKFHGAQCSNIYMNL